MNDSALARSPRLGLVLYAFRRALVALQAQTLRGLRSLSVHVVRHPSLPTPSRAIGLVA